VCNGTHIPTVPIDQTKSVFAAYLDVTYDHPLVAMLKDFDQTSPLLANRAVRETGTDAPSFVDVNGDGLVSPLDALLVARQAIEGWQSVSRWDDADIVHALSRSDANARGAARGLVGVPPGIGLTYRAAAHDHLSPNSLVGVPPGIGLTLQFSRRINKSELWERRSRAVSDEAQSDAHATRLLLPAVNRAVIPPSSLP
jgi:hypothetical protein